MRTIFLAGSLVGFGVVAGCGSSSDDSSGGSTTAMTAATTGATGDVSTGGAPTTGGETAGSSGGSTGSMTTGMSSETGGSTGGTEAGETTGGACIGCADIFMGDDGEACEGSQDRLDALFMCVCGACAEVCEATCTMGAKPTADCQACQDDAFTGACGRALTACLNDV